MKVGLLDRDVCHVVLSPLVCDTDDFGQVSQPVARHDDAKSKTDVSESEFPDELEESTSAEEEKHQTLRVVAQTIRFHQSLMECEAVLSVIVGSQVTET
jgi:hypothetical protein